jgi:hypothetical protein
MAALLTGHSAGELGRVDAVLGGCKVYRAECGHITTLGRAIDAGAP